MELQYVGKSVERTDAIRKVTGAVRFVADIALPGMLHAKLVRAAHAHAEIAAIDTAAAKAMPGVVAVLTWQDLPQPVPLFGPVTADQPLLAAGRVKFHGEPVAVVLADDEQCAAAAAARIAVEYRPLPHITTVDAALSDGAPLIHAGLPGLRCATNIHSTYEYKWGDVAAARPACAHTLAGTYEFPAIHHSPIEPFGAVAYPQDGGVVVKSPIQHPFILRRVIAAALGLALSQVRVVPTDIGGGFGGKGYAKYEPLLAYLALRTGRPVKLSLTMGDGHFTSRRLSARVRITSGFDADGRFVFQDIVADYLIGAYADAAPRVVAKAGYLGCGPYRVPHVHIVANAIYSNTTPSTAARGFGMPQLVWAIESQLNEAGRLLGIDPLAIRLINLPDRGETIVPGDTPADGHWKQGIQRAADMIGWNGPKPPAVGRGLAIGIKNPIPCAVSNAIVKLHADDSVTVAVGTTEMGQGARTVMAQLAAEELGLPIDKITVVMGDTATVPFDLCTAASRSTVSMGNAVVAACRDILAQLRAMARELDLLGRDEQEVAVAGGLVRGCGDVISYPALLQKYLGFSQGEVIGRGIFKGTKGDGGALGGLTDFYELIFQAAEVRVDTRTGKVTVTKFASVSDAGKVINPLQAEAQEEGSAVMGLGHTLFEQMVYGEDGRLQNGGPLDYRIPTALDVPRDLKSAFLENGDGPGPYGAKGIGESGTLAAAPAIAAAVHDAVGVKITTLPLTAEKVWFALQRERRG